MISPIRNLAIFALAIVISACSTPPKNNEPQAEPEPIPEIVAAPEPVPASPTAPPEPEQPDLAHLRLTIAAVGDMMIGTDYPENHLPDDDGAGFLADVSAVLSAPDLTFGNLEGVLVDGGEPGKQCSNPNACYLFRSPSRYIEHYKKAGFDVLSLANNHARDFGEEGRLATMQTIARAGLAHSGLEGDFASLEVNGLKVAVLAYAVTKNSNMLLDYDLSRETIASYSASHDIVIVSFHGGAEGQDVMRLPFAEEEYYGEPRGDVVKFARLAVDAGADLVLGHGPHVVRAMEVFEGKLVAYSLGNFATYYGISVAGDKGIAPILVATLDGNGDFVEGHIHSTIQIRPAGPSFDNRQRALQLIRNLSNQDFGNPGIEFQNDGRIKPRPRQLFISP